MGEYVHCYAGIPYARPPVGQLRFKKPLPVDSWRNTFYANEARGICLQLNIGRRNQVLKFSEKSVFYRLFSHFNEGTCGLTCFSVIHHFLTLLLVGCHYDSITHAPTSTNKDKNYLNLKVRGCNRLMSCSPYCLIVIIVSSF